MTENKKMDEAILKFPPNFLWGVAVSSHQVEGNNTNNDWHAWEQDGKALHQQVAGSGPDFYNKYKEDFQIAHDMELGAFRLSIEWSRVEPEKGKWDKEAWAHYRRMLEDAQRKGLKIFLTLHHFTNPLWLVDEGGWLNKGVVERFVDYTHKAVKEVGDLVDVWMTINEPLVYASQSYLVGVWPPQHRSFWEARRVAKNMAKAHKKAYTVIHRSLDKKDKRVMVGFAKSVNTYQIYNKYSFKDQLLSLGADWVWNRWFYRLTRGFNDYLGLNYYFHFRIARARFSNWQFFVDIRKEKRDTSDVGWEIYPPGIFDIVMSMAHYGLPIYITENGLAAEKDNKRSRFIVSYIKELYHAIEAGAPVKGYFHWSLLDNWEWEKGYEARFGLVAFDPITKKRTLKESAHVYQTIAGANGITHPLLKFVGHVTLGEITVKEK
ncbi:MAG: glycoside hydrolase family 1 protein [Candidatus Komeilibacteria bacterium]|nr:glycoside hydrolase family 1 protein [Candidatus Komeilibacteria bacterium]